MSNQATYVCTALAGTNKAGILKPDADGYYTLVLGAMNVYNSAGAFYPYDSAKDVFKASSSLMRRIANGACRAELGHPKKVPGMSMRDFLDRVMQIHEENVCAHIKEVSIDAKSVKDANGRTVIAVIGKVKPSGPHAAVLKASLENPSENVCFSVRSLTEDVRVGPEWHKHIRNIITWDYVNEPGISVANKYASPALESMAEVTFTENQIKDLVQQQAESVFSMESTGGEKATAVVEAFGWNQKKASAPASADW